MTVTLVDLEMLDSGRFAEALGREEAPNSHGGDPAAELWRAELELYLGRPEAARELAKGFQEADLYLTLEDEPGALARRTYLVRADAAYFLREFDEAELLAAIAGEAAARQADKCAVMRSRMILGRVSLRRGEYRLALGRFDTVYADAARLRNSYYEGLAAYFRGYCLNHLARPDEAEEALRTAARLLDGCGAARWSGAARGMLAAVLCDLGRPAEALPESEAAERAAIELGLVGDALWGRVNGEQALVLLGKYQEAVARFERLVEDERAHQHQAEIPALYWLSVALYELRERHRAEEAARSMLTLAEVIGTEFDQLDARLLLARARGDLEEMKTVLEDVDRSGTERQQAEARAFLAELVAVFDPERAAALVRDAREIAASRRIAFVDRALRRVERDLGAGAVQIEGLVLKVDLNAISLTAKQGAEIMERFLYGSELARARGNQRAAAKTLGTSDADVSRKKAKYGL